MSVFIEGEESNQDLHDGSRPPAVVIPALRTFADENSPGSIQLGPYLPICTSGKHCLAPGFLKGLRSGVDYFDTHSRYGIERLLLLLDVVFFIHSVVACALGSR